MLNTKIKKHINKLHQKKYRKEYFEFLVEGIKGVEEAIDSNFEILCLVIDGKRREEKGLAELMKKAEQKEMEICFAGRNDIDDIKTTDTFSGVLAVVAQQERELEEKQPIICLDGVSDPGNMGTIIRTADWFGVKNILLSEKCVDVYNEKVVRSTMGSIFHTNIVVSKDIVQHVRQLKKQDYRVVALTIEGEELKKLKPELKTIYIFGSESHGVSPELEKLAGHMYTIPGSGKAESLNVGVAVGIVLNNI